MGDKVKKIPGSNMDIDFSNADFGNSECPWNVADKTNTHKCAVKNTSICKYFCGIQYLDSVLCSYPYENKTVLSLKEMDRELDILELVLPAAGHQATANEFKEEFFAAGETVINGSALLDQMEYPAWLRRTEQYRHPDTAGSDWAPSTTFFVVRKNDGKIIGIVDIRHHINHPFLQEYGGHIGYAVRPLERKKGYATKILELALRYAQKIGIAEVMLGCYTDNQGSIKTILGNGGVLMQEKPYTDGKPMYIYRINL